uniref:Uncharacterized protein n=1 Tax=Arundo donax TaxID=35708 RepID=A0A0A9CDK1_ARUDO
MDALFRFQLLPLVYGSFLEARGRHLYPFHSWGSCLVRKLGHPGHHSLYGSHRSKIRWQHYLMAGFASVPLFQLRSCCF